MEALRVPEPAEGVEDGWETGRLVVFDVPIGRDEQERRSCGRARDRFEQVERGLVGGVDVFDDDHCAAVPRRLVHEPGGERVEASETFADGIRAAVHLEPVGPTEGSGDLSPRSQRRRRNVLHRVAPRHWHACGGGVGKRRHQ